jgi:hypothetical protein
MSLHLESSQAWTYSVKGIERSIVVEKAGSLMNIRNYLMMSEPAQSHQLMRSEISWEARVHNKHLVAKLADRVHTRHRSITEGKRIHISFLVHL